MPNEVMIDGVLYAPASNSIANGEAIAEALIRTWLGNGKITRQEREDYMRTLRVRVMDDDEGDTLQEFMATLNKTLEQDDSV